MRWKGIGRITGIKWIDKALHVADMGRARLGLGVLWVYDRTLGKWVGW